MPKLRLCELVNANGASTSPFVWRVKFALQFKGLDYTREEVSFFDIPRIGPGILKAVPVVEHNGEFRSDSWAIVEWLDVAFAARRLFSGPAEHADGALFRQMVWDTGDVPILCDRYFQSREA